jgi:hypothetical protein
VLNDFKISLGNSGGYWVAAVRFGLQDEINKLINYEYNIEDYNF